MSGGWTHFTVEYVTASGRSGRRTVRFVDRWRSVVEALERRGATVERVTLRRGSESKVVLQR